MMDLRQLIAQAVQLHQAGRYAQAEPLYTQALAFHPGNYPALHLLGLMRMQQNRVPEAITLMEQALKAQPNTPETLANYGMALKAAGRYRDALAVLNKEVALRPGHARSLNNRGTVLALLQRTDAALADFDQALMLDGRNVEILANRAVALQALHRFCDAAAVFGQILALRPNDIETWNRRGICWREAGNLDAALADFDKAQTLAPGNPGIALNRASILLLAGREDEAQACYDALVTADPALAAARFARAALYERRKLLGPAIADLRAAWAQQPDMPYLQGRLLHLKMAAGDWTDFDADKSALDDAVRAGRRATEPFIYNGLSDSPEDLQTCCRQFSADCYPVQTPLVVKRKRMPGRIRIGYVAGEFHNHATMLMGIGLFEHHDADQFEIFAFDNGASDDSAMRARFEAAVPNIVGISGLGEAEAAQRIAAAQIDILVNLNGYAGLQRTGIFARRPAPLQVNYLGFPGTMGAPYMDYILADRQLIADSEQQFYDEKIAWLPGSYQINDSRRALPQPASRADHCLPDQAFVFCAFNAAYKITPDVFALWMRLLSQSPGSVLWMLDENDSFADNMRRATTAHAIAPERLIFAARAPQTVHLARLALADLFVDTLPCTAHTLASDALWAGLPLLTCRGSTFAGRVAASLLTAADVPELIANNLADYESLALALARDPVRLQALRDRLTANRGSSALFDSAATTRQIESAYIIMLQRHQAAKPPRSFLVS